MKSREQKQTEAKKRQDDRQSRTDEEQLLRLPLDGAKKERARLEARIALKNKKPLPKAKG